MGREVKKCYMHKHKIILASVFNCWVLKITMNSTDPKSCCTNQRLFTSVIWLKKIADFVTLSSEQMVREHCFYKIVTWLLLQFCTSDTRNSATAERENMFIYIFAQNLDKNIATYALPYESQNNNLNRHWANPTKPNY